MNNNASAYKINQRLRLVQTDLNDYRAALNHSIVNLGIAKWVTFILYFTAVWTLYVYDVWGVADFLTSNMGDMPAFAIFGTVSVMLPRFLSRTKEDRYKDIAEDTASGYRLTTVAILTLIFFASSGLFFELFTATSQQQHITTTAAENSKSFQQTQSTITIASTNGDALASAERKVALCYAKKEKTCVGDEARVASLKEQQARDSQQQIAAGAALFTAQHAAREELKEEANKPLFKMIRDSFGVSINTGMIIGVAIMITIFELTHIINLFTYASRLRRWRETNEQFIEMNGEYMELTGHVVSTNDFDDMKKPVKAPTVSQPTIPQNIPQDFKTPVTEKAEPAMTKQPDFNNAAVAVNNRPALSTIASTIKMIVNGVDTNKATTLDDIKKAVYNTYSVIPNPAELDDAELDKVAEKIAQDRGINQTPIIAIETPTPTSRPMGFISSGYSALPKNQYIGGTGIHNPALGKAEAIFPLPLADQSEVVLPHQSEPVLSGLPTPPVRFYQSGLLKSDYSDQSGLPRTTSDYSDEKIGELNKKLAEQQAEMDAKKQADLKAAHQSEVDRKALEAKHQAEVAEAGRKAAEAAAAQAEVDRKAAAHQSEVDRKAAEAAAAKEAADRLAAAEQEAADRAERGGLTDEQIALAADVIRNAIQAGHITTLGFTATSPILKAAGLPVSTEKLKTLLKLACKVLAAEGVTKLNPSQSRGLPLYIIA
jgi:hypothetical protein